MDIWNCSSWWMTPWPQERHRCPPPPPWTWWRTSSSSPWVWRWTTQRASIGPPSPSYWCWVRILAKDEARYREEKNKKCQFFCNTLKYNVVAQFKKKEISNWWLFSLPGICIARLVSNTLCATLYERPSLYNIGYLAKIFLFLLTKSQLLMYGVLLNWGGVLGEL